VSNLLDSMTWKQRFYAAFAALLEMERKAEEFEVLSKFHDGIVCRYCKGKKVRDHQNDVKRRSYSNLVAWRKAKRKTAHTKE